MSWQIHTLRGVEFRERSYPGVSSLLLTISKASLVKARVPFLNDCHHYLHCNPQLVDYVLNWYYLYQLIADGTRRTCLGHRVARSGCCAKTRFHGEAHDLLFGVSSLFRDQRSDVCVFEPSLESGMSGKKSAERRSVGGFFAGNSSGSDASNKNDSGSLHHRIFALCLPLWVLFLFFLHDLLMFQTASAPMYWYKCASSLALTQ